ncbi:NAD-dependent dihydropyrimidine dehydrogenase subunit PreA [Clostridium rectalis]|uniref:NAD-dependent dihydropyrimidine dehydrogenase subunit PreA n=1 Tax=Clostridium rectalis TaxID=2040295 RepID=UPI000F634D4D|nr:NAD-dependent dihydropyrimidine dehydrogenase subunit PreA [Clostridium rectalis]
MKKADLSIEFCGVNCENPFFLSSSPVSNNYEMCAKAFDNGWGGVVFKTIGFFIANEVSPRFCNLNKEGISFIGFKNMEQIAEHGLEYNLEQIKKIKENYPDKVLVASIMGQNEEEWTKLAKVVEQAGADIIECNFSCPQMTSHSMGVDVGQSKNLVKMYSKATKKGSKLPVLAKMTPNIGNMKTPAIASIEGGANGIAAINTIKSIINIDLNKLSALPIINGKSSISGYSGKAIKPIALRFICELAKCNELKNVPISGIGGIETWEDALEFIMLGASNVQVTTAVMQYGYRIVEDMISGLSFYMEEKGFKTVKEMVGLAVKNIVPPENLERDYIIYPEFNFHRCVGCGRCYISCYDGGHQAIKWNKEDRTPQLEIENCVGCHLCSNVCPANCIEFGEVKFKDNCRKRDIVI